MPITAEDVWTQFGAGLRSFVRRRVSDHAQVEDLVSEIVLRVHRHLDSLADGERLTVWIFRIARNVIKDHYRSGGSASRRP